MIHQWVDEIRLSKRERSKLEQRFDRFGQITDPGRQLPGLLIGPGIDDEKEIYKLQVGRSGSENALRPLACRGPFDKNQEVTLLAGAVERDGALKPNGVAATAERHRQVVRGDRERRRPHESVA